MSENTPSSDVEAAEAATPAVPEVAGREVRPELRLEVIGTHTGQFGQSDAGDTSGYNGTTSVVALAPAAVRPYGSWFDEVVDALVEDLQDAGVEPADAVVYEDAGFHDEAMRAVVLEVAKSRPAPMAMTGTSEDHRLGRWVSQVRTRGPRPALSRASISARARVAASAGAARSSSTTTNSSPPRRAMVS